MTTETRSVELESLRAGAQDRYDQAAAQGLDLDMTRGKPSPEQLDLAAGLLETVDSASTRTTDKTDGRNYGNLEGLPETRALFSELLGIPAEQILVGDNSSLSLMHDTIVQALLVGVPGGRPWRSDESVRFVCPVPGYDRHFAILERYGIDMTSVPIEQDGPAMAAVEELVAGDPSIKGMFCVPRYSNPTGCTYSDEVVERLAAMKTAAPDFRIWWDDAYAVHHLGDGPDPLPDMLEQCRNAGNPDRVFVFASTSKISLAGAGLAIVASSPANVDFLRKARFVQTIGPDKLNQLRHVRFFRNAAGVLAHMDKHAAILRPKFDAVLEVLEHRLGELGIASWTKPRGGYFISLDTQPGCARRVVELAARAGVKLTPAGSTFPYKRDPQDRNLRLAPSLPQLDELRKATELLCDCVILATAEQA